VCCNAAYTAQKEQLAHRCPSGDGGWGRPRVSLAAGPEALEVPVVVLRFFWHARQIGGAFFIIMLAFMAHVWVRDGGGSLHHDSWPRLVLMVGDFLGALAAGVLVSIELLALAGNIVTMHDRLRAYGLGFVCLRVNLATAAVVGATEGMLSSA
ncbi:unnamed protein product, partial [Prorocentrum cordatum]